MADRLEAREGIVIDLAKMRIDDERIAVDDERVAIGSSMRHRLISDRSPTAGSVLDDNGWASGPIELLAKKPREDIGAPAWRKRDNYPDRSRRLARSALTRQHQRDKDKGGGADGHIQEFLSGEQHRGRPPRSAGVVLF